MGISESALAKTHSRNVWLKPVISFYSYRPLKKTAMNNPNNQFFLEQNKYFLIPNSG